MNRKRSRQIREQVFIDLGYEPTADDPKRKIIKDPDFKTVYRAAKKNHMKSKTVQRPRNKLSRRAQRSVIKAQK